MKNLNWTRYVQVQLDRHSTTVFDGPHEIQVLPHEMMTPFILHPNFLYFFFVLEHKISSRSNKTTIFIFNKIYIHILIFYLQFKLENMCALCSKEFFNALSVLMF